MSVTRSVYSTLVAAAEKTQKRPKRLTYVSCHAATLARDLKALKRTFRIDRVALLDLFPQTGHMEVVVQMSAASGRI